MTQDELTSDLEKLNKYNTPNVIWVTWKLDKLIYIYTKANDSSLEVDLKRLQQMQKNGKLFAAWRIEKIISLYKKLLAIT